MTGYVTMCDGRRSALPALLQWDIKLTDGDPCDGFSVCFPYERALAQTLRGAVFFTAEEDGATVFTGVVDDYEITLDAKGLLAEMTGRGMAARLLDNQVRAAEYLSAQLADILKSYVLSYGVTKLRTVQMPAVERFVVETGYSCWQVLAGFCRHSADIFPRFLPDGTLVLEPETPGKTVRLRQAQCLRVRALDSRYGLSSRQVMVNTRTGAQTAAENAPFIALGGSCVKVHGMTGSKLRATWRTAQQRLEDDRRGKRLIEVRVPGAFTAQPMDRVELELEKMGIAGTYTVQAAESVCGADGMYCILTLRE